MAENQPLRVLQINSGSENFGGVSSFLFNVYTHIDRSKIQFDFLSPNITTYGIHKKEIKQMGGKIYALGITGNVLTKKVKLFFRLKRFLKVHPYSIVHINSGNFFFNLFVAKAAKKAKITNLYIHSHSTENPASLKAKKKATVILKSTLAKCGSRLLACSNEAAEYMFGKKRTGAVKIVRNGVSVDRFVYDETIREKIRTDLNINDYHVVGNVGRFSPPKNHDYMIDVFSELYKKDKRAVLLLIGDGEEKTRVVNRIKERGISDRVTVLGTQKDIEKYYQAMDVFLFPSTWEGLGMVLVEAQISGLPCIASTRVPREAAVCENVKFLDISAQNVGEWVETIMNDMNMKRKSRDKDAYRCGYSIERVASELERLYLQDADTK